MYVYWLACQQALGVRPVESVTHFLRPQAEFACDFDDAQSADLTAQLTHAIDAQFQEAAGEVEKGGVGKRLQLN